MNEEEKKMTMVGSKVDIKPNKLEEAMELFEKNLLSYRELLEDLEKILGGLLLGAEPTDPKDKTELEPRSDIIRAMGIKNEKLESLNCEFREIIDRVNL